MVSVLDYGFSSSGSSLVQGQFVVFFGKTLDFHNAPLYLGGVKLQMGHLAHMQTLPLPLVTTRIIVKKKEFSYSLNLNKSSGEDKVNLALLGMTDSDQ